MIQKKQNRINLTLPAPYPAQLPVIKACLDKDSKFITLVASRQSGKTLAACIVGIYWALSEPGQCITIISPVDSQIKKIYKQIMQMLEPAIKHVVQSYKIQSGDSEIVFKNKSVILFRSAASENSLRGYSNTHLILDECAFIKQDTYETIIAPTLLVRGKKVFFCSTPRGDNFFKKLFNRGAANESGYKSFKINFRDNPYANMDFIRGQQEVLPPDIFNQEYEAEFIDSTGVFKNIEECSTGTKQTPNAQKCVVGVDIAFVNDYCVAVAIDLDGNMLDYIRFNGVEAPEMVKRLMEFNSKWQPVKTIIESNSQGLPIIHLLKQAGMYRIEPFLTTAKSKGEIINNLMIAFGKKEIKTLKDETVIGELRAFTYSLNKNGHPTFAAAYGTDDIVMALAFAWHSKLQQAGQKLYFY